MIRDKKTGLCIEVQVRTLFEEAWSEIDHKLRYPYKLSNEMIRSYLEIMNRAAGIKRAQKYKELMSGPEMFEDILKNM